MRYAFDGCGIYRCPNCELMFLFPRPSVSDLKALYDDRYFSNRKFLNYENEHLYGYVDYIAERIGKQFEDKSMVRKTKDMLSAHEGRKPRWLDVGCGLGYLLDIAFDEGFDVQGVEYNQAAVNYIRSKYVYPVSCEAVGDMRPTEKFDVVSLMDVVEHLLDPFKDLEHIRSLMADNGVLVIATMDSDSVMSRLLGKRLEDFRRTREHLYFFSRRSLTRALTAAGFDVVGIQSRGHTFALRALLDRLACYSPWMSRALKALVYPRWLLEAHIYVNPHTKILVYARPTATVARLSKTGATDKFPGVSC